MESEAEVLKNTKSIIKDLRSMDVIWADKKMRRWREKISENLKKKQRMNGYIDILEKKICKDNGGPVTDAKELDKLVKILQRIN